MEERSTGIEWRMEPNRLLLFAGGRAKTVEWINEGVLRIYETKNSEELVSLHYRKAPVEVKPEAETAGRQGCCAFAFGDCVLSVDEALTLRMTRDGAPYFEEYAGEDTVVYARDREFDLALLEGHKDVEKLENFNSQMNFRLFDGRDRLYGLGDKAAPLNRRDYEYVSWNTDDPSEHNETYRSLYKSINYLLVNHHETAYYGLFYPSSYKCVFNLGRYSSRFFYIGSAKGEYDYFLFVGETPRDITAHYSELVGRPLLPPMKFLGYHQSRWSYTEQELRTLLRKRRELSLPLDYAYLDIDYMDRYKVYTVSDGFCADVGCLSEEFAREGVGLIPILDPAVKVEEGYPVYDALSAMHGFATRGGEDYVNVVWPGESKYPDYFRKETADYLTEETMRFLEKYRFSGIWCDMNEPASFRGPLPDDVTFSAEGRTHTHDEVHNLYAEAMVKCVARAFTQRNLRPAVITRAAFATTSAYTTSWNGDNQSLWEHLAVSLPQVMTMNLCNFTVNGVDVGGFGNDTTKELLLRWVEANVFSPYFRNHSCKNSRDQEPYAFDGETQDIYCRFVRLRYAFLPYLYDLLWQAHTEGVPMYRPLFFDYPEDERAKECNDEVMVGDRLLLAPIVRQGERSRLVYLPKGDWIDHFTGKRYEGGREYVVPMPLDRTGLFVKAGSIVPMFDGLLSIEKKKLTRLCLYLAPTAPSGVRPHAEYLHHEDDGETLDYQKGAYREYRFVRDGNRLTVETLHAGCPTTYRELVIRREGKETVVPFTDGCCVTLQP